MISKRVALAILAVVVLASIAMAAAWQFAAESAGNGAVAVAPSSRSMFPKVLNH